jgi:hypothetical protein
MVYVGNLDEELTFPFLKMAEIDNLYIDLEVNTLENFRNGIDK